MGRYRLKKRIFVTPEKPSVVVEPCRLEDEGAGKTRPKTRTDRKKG